MTGQLDSSVPVTDKLLQLAVIQSIYKSCDLSRRNSGLNLETEPDLPMVKSRYMQPAIADATMKTTGLPERN